MHSAEFPDKGYTNPLQGICKVTAHVASVDTYNR